MATFNLDENMIMEAIMNSLEEASYQASDEQMANIANAINDSFPGIIGLITQTVAEEWRAEAKNAGGWGTKYATAVDYKIDDTTGEVFLNGEKIDKNVGKPYLMFAMMMERGVSSWSIKDALMKSDKAKTGPDGVRYITVPMPVRTPAKNKATSPAKQFGKREMTNDIHRIVKSKGRIKSAQLESGQDVSGLTRYITRQKHESYGIFRRVSKKSKGWNYPNIPAEPVFKSVLDNVNKIVSEAISQFCSDIVKEFTT